MIPIRISYKTRICQSLVAKSVAFIVFQTCEAAYPELAVRCLLSMEDSVAISSVDMKLKNDNSSGCKAESENKRDENAIVT